MGRWQSIHNSSSLLLIVYHTSTLLQYGLCSQTLFPSRNNCSIVGPAQTPADTPPPPLRLILVFPPLLLTRFVTSSSLSPVILPFLKHFVSFTGGLSCVLQWVWRRAAPGLLPQRPPVQHPLPILWCLHTTQLSKREGGEMQWLVGELKNQHYDIKILSKLMISTKYSHLSKWKLVISHCFHPALVTGYTVYMQPLWNLKN